MDSLQDQMTHLNEKVDALHEVLEQSRDQILVIMAELKSELKLVAGEKNHLVPSGANAGRYSYQSRSSLNSSMEHKDVLSDDNYPDSETQSGDRILAPEVQIQRLTAQLTAAYNRIAALEEQLLLKRIQ
jgi:hypothetical protein